MSASLDNSADPRAFIAENAWQSAYWSDLAREAATIGDDALLAYATRKAAAYAGAFVGAAKDMLQPIEGGARDERTLVNIGASRARLAGRTGSTGSA